MVSYSALIITILFVSTAWFFKAFSTERKARQRLWCELEGTKASKERLETEKAACMTEISVYKSQIQNLQDFMQTTQKWLEERFESLSNDALLRSQKSFFDMAKETFSHYHTVISGSMTTKQQEMATIISPLKNSLELLDKKVHELELSRKGAYEAIVTQLQQVSATQVLLHKETSSLHRVLKDPSVRGRWGEVQLRRVVEIAGMLPHTDFSEQVYYEGDEGILRPDMIIHLPHQKEVVIDAKVSLSAYLDAIASDDIAVKETKLLLHAKQVRQHVIKLSQKKYWEQFEKAPDFIILFLHGDCFLAPALEYDKELLEFASAHKVLIATPTSLIAMLKIIASAWQEATIEEHAKQIVQEAKTWIERSKTFVEHFSDLGKHLEKTVKSYDKAASSYENRLNVSVRRLASSGLSLETIPPLVQIGSVPEEFSIESSLLQKTP